MKEQLPLTLQFPESLRFDNFYPGANEQSLVHLKSLDAATAQSVYLWGGKGTGKTHLCQALYHHWTEIEQQPAYIDVNEPGMQPQVLEGLEQFKILIIDGIDAVIMQQQWQEAIFHVYNRLMSNHGNLIIAARVAPQNIESLLPDLSSRLLSGLVFEIKEMSDNGKLHAMKQRAKEYGFKLPNDVGIYLLNHAHRGSHEIFQQLRTLDKASLVHKRKLTIPFVKEILALS